jgi:integrase/recombinase XerD
MKGKTLSPRRPKINPKEQEILVRLRQKHTPLRDRFMEDLRFHQYSTGTAAHYLEELLRLTAHYWRSPAELTDEDLRAYFRYLRDGCRYSGSSLGVTHAALTFFYGFTCLKEMPFLRIFRSRKDKTLPSILSREEVRAALARVDDERYRACLTLIYSCGLRIGEAVKIEVSDIDSERGLLLIRKGKGGKDRLVPLPTRTLEILRETWRQHHHPRLLFPAYRIDTRRTPKRYGAKDHPVSPGVIEVHFKAALRASGCRKEVGVHSLRHAFTTHGLEEGVPIFTLKEILGHADIKSTMVYLHYTSKIRRDGMGSIENLMRDL